MNSKKGMMTYALAMVCCLTATLFGVTDQEVQEIRSAMPDKAVAEPSQPRNVLVFSLCNGYKHGCIPYWIQALDVMAEKTGAFKVVHSTDMNVFTEASLKQFDVICFNNTTKLTPDASQQTAILDFIKGGKGIVGIHAATDNFDDWQEGAMMMGGVFKGHPWGGGGTWAVKIDDPDHPLMKPFGGKGFKINDEIYRTLPPHYSRNNQRVLMSLDMSDPTTMNADGVTPDDMDTGISWIKSVGKGRLFYCSLGHNNHLTWNTAVLGHYLAGIQYAAGDLKVDDRLLGDSLSLLQTEKLDALIGDLKAYDWAKPRASLIQLHDLIKKQYANPKILKAIELKLADTLDSEMSLASKDFVCRQLAMIGTDASVPALLKMLDDPKTADLGRFALEKIPSTAVDQGLLAKLETVSNADTKVGIIISLGIRRCDEAVEKIAVAAAGNEAQIANAAIGALGSIGSKKSANTLKTLPTNERVQNALLCCADSLIKQGQISDAKSIYRQLYTAGNPSVIRAGALIGLMRAGSNASMLPKALKDSDTLIQAAAAAQIASVKDDQVLQTLASQMRSQPDAVKIQMVAAFGENEKKVARTEIEQILAQTENQDVRIAAYQTLSKVGNASTAGLLAGYAVRASDRDEKKRAKEALYRLPGKEVDEAILNEIASASSDSDEAVIVELIQAAAQRPILSACPVLLKAARSSNQKISSGSIRALQALATPAQMDEVVGLLVEMPSGATEKVVIATAGKIEDQNSRGQAILAQYDSTTKENAKVSMLRVLGKLGDQNAVELLKKEFLSKEPALQEAAFRAMAQWPGNDFMKEMKALARSDKDAKTKILAFRAYIRMVDASATDENRPKTVDTLIGAFTMAQRPDEQKIVISTLGNYGHRRALIFVKKTLDEPALKAEAEVSLIKISEKLLSQNPSAVRSVLQNLKETSENKSIQKQAEELLGKLAG